MVKYMFKKFFSIFLFGFLSITSFRITKMAIEYIRELDPIMNNIESSRPIYEVKAVNATISDMTITPGISGSSINVDSSYKMMKKYGSFSDNLLVFSKVAPIISIANIFDKYIFNGNPEINNVSFIFKIKDTNYIEEITSILKSKDVIGTFFIDDEVLLENKDIIKYLYLNNQIVQSLGNDEAYDILELDNIDHLLKGYTNKGLSYCYSDNINNSILNVCSRRKLHTIVPSVNTDKFPYYEMKNEVENGVIIKFNNNLRLVDELPYIINYIRQNNKKIVSLEKLLEE